MKRLFALPVSIVFASALFYSYGDRTSLKEVTRRVDSIVTRLKGADPVAAERIEARKVHFLDFDKDGTQDAIVFS